MEGLKKKLASGRTLQITLGSFDESHDLWMVLMEEMKGINLGSDVEIDVDLIKDLFCTATSSKKIHEKLSPLLKRCIYNDARIDSNSFATAESREDYLEIIELVAMENIAPFVKGLVRKYKAKFSHLMSVFQKLKQPQQPT